MNHQRFYFKQKKWYRNMREIIVNYFHLSEDNYDKFLHMLDKERIDRLGGDSKVLCTGRIYSYNRVWNTVD